jgi:hypothetical protein
MGQTLSEPVVEKVRWCFSRNCFHSSEEIVLFPALPRGPAPRDDDDDDDDDDANDANDANDADHHHDDSDLLAARAPSQTRTEVANMAQRSYEAGLYLAQRGVACSLFWSSSLLLLSSSSSAAAGPAVPQRGSDKILLNPHLDALPYPLSMADQLLTQPALPLLDISAWRG